MPRLDCFLKIRKPRLDCFLKITKLVVLLEVVSGLKENLKANVLVRRPTTVSSYMFDRLFEARNVSFGRILIPEHDEDDMGKGS